MDHSILGLASLLGSMRTESDNGAGREGFVVTILMKKK